MSKDRNNPTLLESWSIILWINGSRLEGYKAGDHEKVKRVTTSEMVSHKDSLVETKTGSWYKLGKPSEVVATPEMRRAIYGRGLPLEDDTDMDTFLELCIAGRVGEVDD